MSATTLSQLLLPLAELGTLLWLYRRIAYTRYPALMIYLATEAFWHATVFIDYRIATRIGAVPRMALRTWVVIEVFRFACLRWNLWQRVQAISLAVANAAVSTAGMYACIGLSPAQGLFAFRQYFGLWMAGALIVLCVRVMLEPVAENRDHAAYRLHMAIWLTILAIEGTFVRGGLGFLVVPWSREAWDVINIVGYLAKTANVALLARRMTANVSCFRPEVAFKGLYEGDAWMGSLARK